MRRLHVIPTIDPASGGPVEGLRQLCEICQDAGHDIEIASLDSSEFLERTPFPAKVTGLGPGDGTYRYTPRAIPWLRANHSRFDAVVAHGIWQFGAIAVHRALRGSSTPYGVFIHGMLDPYFRKNHLLKHLKKSVYWHLFLRPALREARQVYFTCEEERILARQSFPGYWVREQVVPYGSLGPECNLEGAAREFLVRWPQLRGKRLAINLGRVHEKKGLDILIEAFAGSLARDPEWHAVIAGPDSTGLGKQLKALASRLGLAERVTWTGMLKGELKWGALAASDVFVLPSHQESFGIAVAEALSCRLPVVISDKVNIWREVERHGGGLVCSDNVETTRASLERLMAQSGEEVAAFRTRAQRCFDAEFNLHSTSKRVVEIFEELALEGSAYPVVGSVSREMAD